MAVSKSVDLASKPVAAAASKPASPPTPIVTPAPRATAKAADDDWEEF
jgi:hypothetical protein